MPPRRAFPRQLQPQHSITDAGDAVLSNEKYKASRQAPGSADASKRSYVYRDSSCKGYKAMAQRRNVMTFKTAAEAEEAGYGKASDCPRPTVKK